MEKYIYKCLLFVIACSYLGSCRLYQSRDKESWLSKSDMAQHHKQIELQYGVQHDSQSRYWLFWSDSNFRFHPDSGLIGQHGQLVMLESKVNTGVKNELSSQSSDRRFQTELKSSIDKRRSRAIPNLWLITLLGAIVLLFGWKFRKFFKTFLP
ncbi:hypothetical protein OHD16_19415 [Sphingobacterium sp. ML3W]|uniref:hypothetical protein n=1 Tax=Sphingobacterium sp. ML3W TaxID=1538644 RepID=UPI00249B63FA|nr:hypothetical protein [Sphingobacterium sp. ML3W]WFA82128.1 hypothetical protein OGI71_12555 [Sphingobacterium sp. ML3W]